MKRFVTLRHVTDLEGLRSLPVLVYGLVDPRDNTVRYIGQTTTPENRFNLHYASPVNDKMAEWFKDVMDATGGKVWMRSIARASFEDAGQAERYWIAFYRSVGILLNVNDGGEAPINRRRRFQSLYAEYEQEKRNLGV